MWPLDHDRASSSVEDKGQRKMWKGRSRVRYFLMVLGKCYSLEESAGLLLSGDLS